MHPKALVEACTELVRLTLKFDHPADAVVSKFFRDYRKTYAFGPRERAALAETVYNVLRNKLRYDHFAPSGSGPKERRLAILGFAQHLKDQAPANNAPKSTKHANHSPLDFLMSALNKQEAAWLEACEAVNPSDLMERHRHNMPEWLVEPLKAQVGEGFWPLVERLNGGAPLDLRVNTFTDKRADVQHELKLAGIKAVDTPFSPWGLRIEGKPALSGLDAFSRGAIEVQDEGSQLLALLLDAKRGGGLKVSKTGGQVKTSKTNWFITLAPYFFPFYAMLFIGLFFAAAFVIKSWSYILRAPICKISA